MKKEKELKRKAASRLVRRDKVDERLFFAMQNEADEVLKKYDSSLNGLENETVETSKEKYGKNVVTNANKRSLFTKIMSAFVNPFTIVLFVLATVSLFTDVIFVEKGEENPVSVIIITTMVLISGFLRFIQEARSEKASEKLNEMIETTTLVLRKGEGKREIPIDEVVVGDIVYLSAGDIIPADMRIITNKDLFVDQSSLTGESEPVEKNSLVSKEKKITEALNIAFMGTTVVSGSGIAVVIAVGDDTYLGETAQSLSETKTMTAFEKGVNSVSWLLIRFMLIMVPVVLFINGFTKGDWLEAFLFAISVAVGLTPEMLPMIVTTCLGKGAVSMAKKKVIIKRLNSIQNLGAIDVLCTDKTGALTKNKVVLEKYINVNGETDLRILKHAFLNSYYQTGLKNLMDIALIERFNEEKEYLEEFDDLDKSYTKVDEIPFDFERRRMSVVVSDKNGKTQMITKGAIEEMLKISSFVEHNGEVKPLTEEMKKIVLDRVDELNESGMRVLGVAHKTNPSAVGTFSIEDEREMVLIGYIAFLDPPKETSATAIKALNEYGVSVKVLTGDNEKVANSVCSQIGLEVKGIILGSELSSMSDEELRIVAENTTIFAKLSPVDKARVVNALRDNGHTVGFMGDGINDAPAMKASDVGISVDTAADIAKETADAILLEKDLMVLKEGIIEGRKTYANMNKYIKLTASSNFGNMFSVLVASAFLPFIPMAAIHLIILNLIYDISCTAIPWDNVDKDFLLEPRKWNAKGIGKFMLWIGPTSSVFDITTYILMYFLICPLVCGGSFETLDAAGKLLFISVFQSGWFVESMWSQTLVIHMIRTAKIPFVQSRASLPVTLLTFTGIGVLTIIPFTPLGNAIGLSPLPPIYFLFLAITIILYMVLATIFKKIYIKLYGELL